MSENGTIVRIDLRDKQRQALFEVELDAVRPASVVRHPSGQPEIHLQWEGTRDDGGHLRKCPACGCRELFARKDFPQVTGFIIVVLAALIALGLFGARQVLAGWIVLAAMVVVDAAIYLFAGRCLVCYRCRSEFRDLPIRRDHPGWDLSIGEKYRPVRLAANADRPPDSSQGHHAPGSHSNATDEPPGASS